MCGVFGIWSEEGKVTQDLVKQSIDVINHRGPDGEGIWLSDNRKVGLGHKRLSIIDLSQAARQPMSLNNNKHLVFNGEIYNYRSLKQELKGLNRKFETSSDTEVLLHALDEWGADAVSRLNGMWGFIYVDTLRHELIVSRDRMGMKPLYYYWDEKSLIVASEVKSIIKAGVKAELDAQGFLEYFTYQNIISDRTLFKNIGMIPAGYNFVFDFNKRKISKNRYWDFSFSNSSVANELILIEELENLFEQAIERHLVADVEVGATISGGIDSSSIVNFASRINGRRLKTFTGYFDVSQNDEFDRSVSERDDARLISESFSTDHFELQIFPKDFTDSLEDIVWHLEDPKVGMCYTFHRISQLVSSKLKVNLSGTGGDEVFAGYPWRYGKVEHLGNNSDFEQVLFSCWNRVVPLERQGKAFIGQPKEFFFDFDVREPFRQILSRAETASPINKALYFEAKTFLHGMLMVEDKLGMASSLETRFPLLDVELVKFGMSIPDHLKYKDGKGKYILKRMLEKRMPSEIIYKKKQGFTPPDNTWYRNQLWPYLNALLLSKDSRVRDYFSFEYLEHTLNSHKKGNDERFPIWSLAFFEVWCRKFLS